MDVPLCVSVVTETYPPEVNGVASTVARVVAGLRSCRHDVQLVRPRQHAHDTPRVSDGYRELLVRGVPLPRYPALKVGLPAPGALHRLWTDERPDVVHLATEGPLGWSALHVARRLRLPVVSEYRTDFSAYAAHYGAAWLGRPIGAALRAFHNRTDCTMVPTPALLHELQRKGFRKLEVVARGVDTRLFDPRRRSDALRRHWGAGPRTRVVLCVGRLAPEKNLGLLLDAYAAMRDARQDVRLVLVGDGPARSALQAGCPDAVFAGLRLGAELATHYASADVFVFPSLTETFGNVVPEAMASGVPVLAFDCAAAAQLIEPGGNGWLAACDDPGGFVDQAVRALADPDAARRLGRQARRTALALDWDRIVAQIETHYRRAIAASTVAAQISLAAG